MLPWIQVGFIPPFLRTRPPPWIPLAPGAQHHTWTNCLRVEIRVFHVDFFFPSFFSATLHLSSLDWTRAGRWGCDGWSSSALKVADPGSCRCFRRSPAANIDTSSRRRHEPQHVSTERLQQPVVLPRRRGTGPLPTHPPPDQPGGQIQGEGRHGGTQ